MIVWLLRNQVSVAMIKAHWLDDPRPSHKESRDAAVQKHFVRSAKLKLKAMERRLNER